jgi:hypothetical protein
MHLRDASVMHVAHCVLFLAVMLLSFDVDGNGQVCGLGERASAGVVFFVFSCAALVALWLIIWDRSWRVVALISLALCGGLLLPGLM